MRCTGTPLLAYYYAARIFNRVDLDCASHSPRKDANLWGEQHCHFSRRPTSAAATPPGPWSGSVGTGRPTSRSSRSRAGLAGPCGSPSATEYAGFVGDKIISQAVSRVTGGISGQQQQQQSSHQSQQKHHRHYQHHHHPISCPSHLIVASSAPSPHPAGAAGRQRTSCAAGSRARWPGWSWSSTSVHACRVLAVTTRCAVLLCT